MSGYAQNRGTYSKGGNTNGTAARGNSFGNKAGGNVAKKDEAILTKLLRPSKSGKATSFVVGDENLVIPANTRVVVMEISEKRRVALEKSNKDKGYQSATPTHELLVFPITDKA